MTDVTKARDQAEHVIDQAIGKLRATALEIATEAGIPNNILGLLNGELLGRISYVASVSRDLRSALTREMTGIVVNQHGPEWHEPLVHAEKAQHVPPPEPQGIPAGVSVQSLELNHPVQQLLTNNNIHNVGDLAIIPDERLLQIPGIGPATITAIRAAVNKAAG